MSINRKTKLLVEYSQTVHGTIQRLARFSKAGRRGSNPSQPDSTLADPNTRYNTKLISILDA